MTLATQTEEREVLQEQIDTVFEILEDWYQAIESGTAHHRLPDPSFESPQGRPPITQALVQEFIKELDREIDIDAFGVQGRRYSADASSEFHRLDFPQRVALVQQLMTALLNEKEMSKKAEDLRAQRVSNKQPEAS